MTGDSTHVPPSPRWWAPWSYRRRWRRSAEARGLLFEGVRDFNERTGPIVRPILTELAYRQTPSHLFITCADSRVVPHLITSSGPGDLFILRNIGNLVPPGSASAGAVIEYAVGVLDVGTITVCGHSRCGAVAALLNGDEEIRHLPHLTRWLEHGGPSRARYAQVSGDHDPMTVMCQLNVVQQLENLLTYQVVAERVDAGSLDVVGMYLDIGEARVHVLDPGTGAFSPTMTVPKVDA